MHKNDKKNSQNNGQKLHTLENYPLKMYMNNVEMHL